MQIGFISALTPLSKILFPPFWGGVADRSGGRKSLILLTTALSILAFSLLFAAREFAAVGMVILAYAFFHAPILALSETLVLEESARRGFAYGRIRVWGSLGYLLTALVLGKLLDLTSLEAFVTAFVAVSVLQLAAATSLPSATVPRTRSAMRGVLGQLRRGEVIGFLLACTLMEVSHSGYNGFFSIHLSESGYSRTVIGPLVALPVLCEMAAMVVADGWLRRHGARWMMGLAFTAAAVRWSILVSSTFWIPVVLSQTLHALTYGFFHVTAVHQVRRYFPPDLQASAQSLYIGLTYGMGGAVGLLAAGRFYDAWGGRLLFLASAVVALAGPAARPAPGGVGERRNGSGGKSREPERP